MDGHWSGFISRLIGRALRIFFRRFFSRSFFVLSFARAFTVSANENPVKSEFFSSRGGVSAHT